MWYNMTQLGQVIKGENMVADMPMPTMVRSIAEAKAHFSAIVDEASGGMTRLTASWCVSQWWRRYRLYHTTET